jgi:hypothetical protein
VKKIKLVLLLAAILGISGAFAESQHQKRDYLFLYHWTGFTFLPVWGDYGENYVCAYFPSEVCTYYFDYYSGYYVPYESGQYFDVLH